MNFVEYHADGKTSLRAIVMDFYQSISGHYVETALEDNQKIPTADYIIPSGTVVQLRLFGVRAS